MRGVWRRFWRAKMGSCRELEAWRLMPSAQTKTTVTWANTNHFRYNSITSLHHCSSWIDVTYFQGKVLCKRSCSMEGSLPCQCVFMIFWAFWDTRNHQTLLFLLTITTCELGSEYGLKKEYEPTKPLCFTMPRGSSSEHSESRKRFC